MSYFLLADCNNFFVSCERLFDPSLLQRPVIVLSSNDGCVVARSQEVKAMGIRMGEPYFKIKDFCERMRVAVFSSNFNLYQEISQRVMHILSSASDEVEIYSIDEAFLGLPAGMSSENLFQFCLELRHKVRRWVGIPISLGLAPTKTLAKMANQLAKKEQSVGIFDLTSPFTRNDVLQNYPLNEVWGIGARTAEKLHSMGIRTAGELKEMDPSVIRCKFGVIGERILWELRGTSCFPLEKSAPKKSITCSRSFGQIVTDPVVLGEALATFVSSACVKLRKQKCCAQTITVFLEGVLEMKRQDSYAMQLSTPTDDTAQLIKAAKQCMRKLFIEGERYKKCGVVLSDLLSTSSVVPDFFLIQESFKRKKLMETVDALNLQYGKNVLFYGAAGVLQPWQTKSDKRSPFYTDWNSLAIAHAK